MEIFVISTLILTLFLGTQTGFAGPTHHGLAQSLVQIANANNEADGPLSHQVCFYDVLSPTGKATEDKNQYRALVITRFSEGKKSAVIAHNYSLIVGGYWVAEAIFYVGAERLEKFACPGKPAITYKEEKSILSEGLAKSR